MLKNWLINAVKTIITQFDFGAIIYVGIVESIEGFDADAFVARFGDSIAQAIANKFEDNPQALQALIEKILQKLAR